MYGNDVRRTAIFGQYGTTVCSVRNCSENTNVYGVRPFTIKYLNLPPTFFDSIGVVVLVVVAHGDNRGTSCIAALNQLVSTGNRSFRSNGLLVPTE